MPPPFSLCTLRAPALLWPRLAPPRAKSMPSTAMPTPRLVRPLSTTTARPYRQERVPNSRIPIPSVTAPHPEIPPYPLGPRQVYHQSNTGLYGSALIRFGNKVSARNKIKTRRAWRPNVHHKRMWSDALGMFVRTRLTTRVLRTIDKVGGLDTYLLGIKPARIAELGPWGWRLRWRIMQTPIIKKQLQAERVALGLDAAPPPLPTSSPPPKAGKHKGAEATASQDDGELDRGGSTADSAMENVSEAQLMDETSRMLANEEEFVIGDAAEEKPFMREEDPRASQSGKK